MRQKGRGCHRDEEGPVPATPSAGHLIAILILIIVRRTPGPQAATSRGRAQAAQHTARISQQPYQPALCIGLPLNVTLRRLD